MEQLQLVCFICELKWLKIPDPQHQAVCCLTASDYTPAKQRAGTMDPQFSLGNTEDHQVSPATETAYMQQTRPKSWAPDF